MTTRIVRATLEDDGLDVVLMVQRFLEGTPYGRYLPFNVDAVAGLVERTFADGIIFVGQIEVGTIAAGGEWENVAMIAAVVGLHPVSGEKWTEELAWWVDLEHRRGRLAYKLLGCLEDWARQNSCVGLKMVAPADSEVGQFYGRVGYTPLETAHVKRL